MKLVIVRHGESVGNKKQVFQGQTDYSLTENGVTQAKSVANELKDMNFDVAYSSDLIRAKDTAKEILKFHPNVYLNFSTNLRERLGGEIETKPLNKIIKDLQKYNSFPFTDKPKGGESVFDLWGRSIYSFEKIKKENEGKNVLIVSHLGPLTCILTYLNNSGPENYTEFIPSNASISIVEFNKGEPKFTKLNYDKHL